LWRGRVKRQGWAGIYIAVQLINNIVPPHGVKGLANIKLEEERKLPWMILFLMKAL
jgi:hypothetical protein